jgi:hypothetical protein
MRHPFAEIIVRGRAAPTSRGGRRTFLRGLLGAAAGGVAWLFGRQASAQYTTYALGEEGSGGGGGVTTQAVGEEGGRYTTFATGEEGGPSRIERERRFWRGYDYLDDGYLRGYESVPRRGTVRRYRSPPRSHYYYYDR